MSPKKADDKRTPSVNVRARGKVNAVLDQLGELYRKSHSNRDCRWTYAPTHKPDLSNVFARRAQGYVPVTLRELPEAGSLTPGMGPDDEIRIGDLILMSIEAEVRSQIAEDVQEAALEQTRRVERSFYNALSENVQPSKSGEGHVAVGRGAVTIEEKTFEYDVEQRTSDERDK